MPAECRTLLTPCPMAPRLQRRGVLAIAGSPGHFAV
jgi:hypothetical protein